MCVIVLGRPSDNSPEVSCFTAILCFVIHTLVSQTTGRRPVKIYQYKFDYKQPGTTDATSGGLKLQCTAVPPFYSFAFVHYLTSFAAKIVMIN